MNTIVSRYNVTATRMKLHCGRQNEIAPSFWVSLSSDTPMKYSHNPAISYILGKLKNYKLFTVIVTSCRTVKSDKNLHFSGKIHMFVFLILMKVG